LIPYWYRFSVTFTKAITRRIWQWIVGLLFVAAGANHFISPGLYVSMVPDYLPARASLVQISGVAEMLGGLGVLFDATRRSAAWGLIVLLVAVFPANLNMALHSWPEAGIPSWLLWVRLPMQAVFIWWVYRIYIAGISGRGAGIGERPSEKP
jgi:uncharacterized membrane protein